MAAKERAAVCRSDLGMHVGWVDAKCNAVGPNLLFSTFQIRNQFMIN